MGRPPREASRDESGRSKRVPLGVPRTKLAVSGREGYVRRWINDDEGRLQQALQGGYQYVEDQSLQVGDTDISNVNRDLGTRMSYTVDKSNGKKAYLMEIKKEDYEADQAEKMRLIDEVDSSIRDGSLHNSDHRYVPENGRGIVIERR